MSQRPTNSDDVAIALADRPAPHARGALAGADDGVAPASCGRLRKRVGAEERRRGDSAAGRFHKIPPVHEILLDICAPFTPTKWALPTLNSRRAASGKRPHLLDLRHRRVARERRDERAVRPSELQRLLRRLAVQQAVNQSRREAITAADAIADVELAGRRDVRACRPSTRLRSTYGGSWSGPRATWWRAP